MTLPKEFERVKTLRTQVTCAKLVAQRARDNAQRMTNLISGMPHAKGGRDSRLECCMVKALDCEARAFELEADLIVAEMEATGLIMSRIDDRVLASVLYLRYVEGLKIKELAPQFWRSERSIMRDCARGLKLLQS